MNKAYLNQYLSQDLYNSFPTMSKIFGFGCDGTSLGVQMGFSIFENLLGAVQMGLASRAYYGAGGGGSRVDVQSEADKQIAELETKKANAEAEVDKAHPELQTNIKAAETKMKKFEALDGQIGTLGEQIGDLEIEIENFTTQANDPNNAGIKDKLEEAITNKRLELAGKKSQIEVLKSKRGALGTKESIQGEIDAANEARTKAIETFKGEIDKQITKIKEKAEEGPETGSEDLNKYNAVQKLLSPKRKAIGNFSSAVKKLQSALQPGKSKSEAMAAAKAISSAYEGVKGLSSNKDGVAAGIDSALRYYEQHKEAIAKVAVGKGFECHEGTDKIKTVSVQV